MAGGKLSPRQKMINLMYLVFIAMLAMQMDKKVLSSFGFMKEKVEDANVAAKTNIDATLSSLATKASDQPDKYGDLNRRAVQVNQLSNSFFSYLESVKDSMLADVEAEDRTNYETMSSGDKVDEMFFTGEGFTPQGQKLLDEINNYRTKVVEILGDSINGGLKTNIEKRFNTDDQPAKDSDKPNIPWLKSRYEGMPLVTSIANITQIQGDIRTSESEVYSALLGGQLESEVSLTNYQGIVKLDKTAYFAGERVQGKVVLGRYDATMVPDKVVLNGRDYKNVQAGQVIIDMPAGNVGNKSIKGAITFTQNGEPVEVPFETDFSVISQPDEAVISADKMNVVYRGLDNPISVSLPGVGDKDLTVSAPGLRKVGTGKYVMRPGSANQVSINVSGKLSRSKTVTSSKTFRVKDIPAAMGMVRGDFGVVRMPKSSVGRAQIGAGLPDFVFDLKLKVNGFKVKVPGQPTVVVSGGQFNARAKKALARARRGDVITVFDINATIVGNSSYKLKKVLPVSIEVSN